MQQSTIIRIIEEIAPPIFAAAWDKSGVQVASPRRDITHLALSLDPTPHAVRCAVHAGANMLLTHHPLSMQPRFPDRLDAHRETLALLFSHDMPLYAAHTSLDANPVGPSAWLPDALDLQHRELLEKTGILRFADGSEVQGGFGCVGDLPSPLTLTELMQALATNAVNSLYNKQNFVNLVGAMPARIHRVAVCTGSGSSLLNDARRAKADIFITGDFKYHPALDLVSENDLVTLGRDLDASDFSGASAPTMKPAHKPENTVVLDVGHFLLEEEMMRRLALLLEQRLQGVAVSFLPGQDPFVPLSLDVPEVLS